ncbi:Site-specific DNA recombinase [Duganella sp. CF402]|uniref:recombinase family protein n=1 Tax=unclassified Duganella TaxID=2636909 RepID=UPI0008B35E30|nr:MULTISPECIES: recombinase family protein [unclassified Duganella]RZT04571.1 DNA invertase Pin-like site-specific DNA recombinase [Duganella sp. BK701]SEM31735.1 Site-specific DNA recombinase [Duganella sp. CF402]
MTIYGYARTSTVEQVAGLADQIAKLKGAGCTDQSIYREQISSVKMEDRIEFAKVLTILRPCDVLVFSSLSRAARSMVHMVEIESRVARAGATIRILDLAVDTATPSGRLTFNLFASIAQFERENMLERQRVGIAAAKQRGAYTGRAPTAQAKSTKVLALIAKGVTKQEVADACGIGIASVYRILKAHG